jgi:hypothetical protein
MRVRMKVYHGGFERLRTLNQAVMLSQGDRRTLVLRTLDRVHREQAKRAFTSQGASTGAAWPPLSPKYATWKRKSGYGRSMMRMAKSYRGRPAGLLYRKAVMAGERGHIAQWLGGLRYAFGFGDDVGFWHHVGAGRLPVRQIITKTANDLAEFAVAVKDLWIKRIRQSFR